MLEPQFSSDYCSLSPSVSLYTIYGIYTHLLQGEEEQNNLIDRFPGAQTIAEENPCSCWGTSLSSSPRSDRPESETTNILGFEMIPKPRLFDQGDGAFNIQKEVLAP